ncbi:MAG: hypothetical protein LBS54_00245 [Dysgonamonadaceae bacterium]|jgi:hypothetical protein|nr:hypothetical protein [Dysgonamonadaceae bacterium]
MMMNELKFFEEPKVEFGYSQSAEDPREGLTLFGPYSKSSGEIRIGIVGTLNGINAYKSFAAEINKPVFTQSAGRPFFPGFSTVFGLNWPTGPEVTLKLSENDIENSLNTKNSHERTYKLVSLYLATVQKYLETEEGRIDLWYIVIPHQIWLTCRPKSTTGRATISAKYIREHRSGQKSLFPEDDEEIESFAKMYDADSDFHDQMKARFLSEKIQTPIQIMLEDTLLFNAKDGSPYNDDMKAHLLWTQCTSVFYKLGHLPWKLYNVRNDVCYIGLVFKTTQGGQGRTGFACCAAQMFLDSGDGMVFRGNIGPWRSEDEKTYHLNAKSAQELIEIAVEAYKDNTGVFPKELFIHGKAHFSDEEWAGFSQAISRCTDTNLVGVTINEIDGFRLYKNSPSSKCKYGILRGLALQVDERNGYLWTKGFIPSTETSNHLEVARPLKISISRGKCDIDTVMRDILCLTKLNYNACIYGDGLPVTLRFSDKIGNILTALTDVNWRARQFKYYI